MYSAQRGYFFLRAGGNGVRDQDREFMRPPPRSRTGCRTCRSRKVKCDEKRPVCDKCRAVGRHCDYGIRYTWHEGPDLEKLDRDGISRRGCPVWDARTASIRRPFPAANSQPLPAFPHTLNDEDRESWAAHYRPGSFFVITNQSSFDNLPEYRQWQANAYQRKVSTPLDSTSDRIQAKKSAARPGVPAFDAHAVFVPYFEETASPSPQPQPTATAVAAAPTAMVTWPPAQQTSLPDIHTQVSPLAAEFSDLMQRPMHAGQYPFNGHTNEYVQQRPFPPTIPLQHPSLNVVIPPAHVFRPEFSQAQSAPTQNTGRHFWPGVSSQRPHIGPRSGSLLEELMGGGDAGRGIWYTEPNDENG